MQHHTLSEIGTHRIADLLYKELHIPRSIHFYFCTSDDGEPRVICCYLIWVPPPALTGKLLLTTQRKEKARERQGNEPQ
jgi:hypothetical protein